MDNVVLIDILDAIEVSINKTNLWLGVAEFKFKINFN
jgi:hypothetical protein